MKRFLFPTVTLALMLPACGVLDLARRNREKVSFEHQVKPILETSCLECHQPRYLTGGLNLETKAAAMKGGRSGPVIVPGSPHKSLLYRVLLLGHESPVAMPPTPERLEREYEQIIHDWILQGADWPEGVRLVPPQEWKKPHA
ncbi:c-type cytochrome domain-containing protein [Prosthecobacter fluviatilis]|uniref:C-type cytochrome domain-containing protein n=1 Tax=Prosthecobacter fluviatilis TaxID=445931 RepID=A0ABW0KWG1_9BACT